MNYESLMATLAPHTSDRHIGKEVQKLYDFINLISAEYWLAGKPYRQMTTYQLANTRTDLETAASTLGDYSKPPGSRFTTKDHLQIVNNEITIRNQYSTLKASIRCTMSDLLDGDPEDMTRRESSISSDIADLQTLVRENQHLPDTHDDIPF